MDQHATCDVCGRTLLRGERSHPFLEGLDRRTVCELCTGRAQHEGWRREGAVPHYDDRDAGSHRRRPLLGRIRRRMLPAEPADTDGHERFEDPVIPPPRAPAPEPAPRPVPSEPRHVRAVPTSLEQRSVAAAEAFNAAEHPRTVAGIARSLGLPVVSVHPADRSPSTMRILVAWELCWYRYETDLGDDWGAVRLADQGDELDELDPSELEANAVADDSGQVRLGA